jgi:hypothetical protein
MQCSDCGYISFKKEKACGACGFKFKKSTQSSQSLAGKESFTIFANSAKEQSKDSPAIESVGILDEQEPSSFIDPETGDFNLNLPETSEETLVEAQISSESTDYESLEFDLDEDIELEEIEGLGLEPLHATETLITEEPALSIEPALEIGEPEEATSLEPMLEIGEPEEIPSLEPMLEIGEPEETPSLEPALEIGEPEETPSLEPALEIGELEETPSLEPALEIGELEETPTFESALEINEPESEEVALDLGENEIALDLDDSPSTPSAPPAAAPLDEIELNLEIDDSDGPLTIQTQDIPELEIEDLGLELESSDDPEPDKP